MMAEIESPNSFRISRRPTPMRFCSIFNQLLQLFPRAEFQRAVNETQAERHARGLHVLGAVRRDAVLPAGQGPFAARDRGGLASCEGRLAHLGITAPKPVDARLCQRASALAAVSSASSISCSRGVRRWRAPKKFRFKNKLLSLDATMIDLCAEMFPWATFRRTQGRGEAALHARPRRLLADGPGDHRGQTARDAGGAPADVCARHDPGVRPRVSRLCRGLPN